MLKESRSNKSVNDLKSDIASLKNEISTLKQQIKIRDIALSSTKISIRITDLDGIIQYVNAAHTKMLGYRGKDRTERPSLESIHPDDRERAFKFFQKIVAEPQTFESAAIEYRLQHKKGHYLWAHAEGKIVKREGKPVLTVFTVWDITERKKMEDELHALAQKLHNVREEERTRISREIHSEFGPALTSLKFDLALLTKSIPAEKSDALDKSKSMMKYIDEIIKLIRRISTELSPPILDDFGLKAAIEWQAEDFQRKTGIKCEIKSELPDILAIEKEKSISIFRIVQEALTNVARHAYATKVTVDFHNTDQQLSFLVKDNGRGITESEMADRTSLGIMGMKERALSMGGELKIRGFPKKGTMIHFRMPLN